MEKGAKLRGSTGNIYEYLGSDNGHFRVTKTDGSSFVIPARDVINLAATMVRPRLSAMAVEFVDKLFKGL